MYHVLRNENRLDVCFRTLKRVHKQRVPTLSSTSCSSRACMSTSDHPPESELADKSPQDETRAVPRNQKKELQRDVAIARRSDTWTLLTIIRIINAVTICTFFQPDEYYQALEPAWALAFGDSSGAWITWVCARMYSQHTTHHNL